MQQLHMSATARAHSAQICTEIFCFSFPKKRGKRGYFSLRIVTTVAIAAIMDAAAITKYTAEELFGTVDESEGASDRFGACIERGSTLADGVDGA
jgi:hypothetical protein